jgi:DNA-binding NarL/FixJ family response regulator
MTFTQNQIDIMQNIADGMQDKQIAHQSLRSIHTVRHTVKAIRLKLKSKSREDAIIKAFCLGLVK